MRTDVIIIHPGVPAYDFTYNNLNICPQVHPSGIYLPLGLNEDVIDRTMALNKNHAIILL